MNQPNEKLVLKIILLFLIVFNFRMPFVYNSVFLSMILATFHYIFTRRAIPFTYFTYRHNATILIATLAMIFVAFVIITLHETSADGNIRRLLVQLSMLLALIYILPILLEGKETEAYERAMLLVCYIFDLQGFIHLAAYFIPPLGDFMISIKSEIFKQGLLDPGKNLDRFRGYALSGSVYFELPSAYGVAFILFIRLQLIEGQKYLTGYKSYIILFLFIAGIMLTGRVGFVGIGVGMGLYFLCVKDPITVLGRILKNMIAFSPTLLIIWFFILSPTQRTSIENEIFPFAFEMYYRFRDTGTIGTWSSDVTFHSFYYPLREETLLWGHGVDNIYELLNMYTFTDAGYMRMIMFGGIPYLTCIIIYQFLYFSKPIKAALQLRDKEAEKDLYCFLFLFAYILILHIKDMALGLQHLTEVLFLFIGFSYLIKYYAKLEK
jgi:hypothetical protein